MNKGHTLWQTPTPPSTPPLELFHFLEEEKVFTILTFLYMYKTIWKADILIFVNSSPGFSTSDPMNLLYQASIDHIKSQNEVFFSHHNVYNFLY